MSPFLTFLQRPGVDGDGAIKEDLQWVIHAAQQSQRCAFLTLALMTALGYEQVLTIAQEASQTLSVKTLYSRRL